jgi:16S rRNA (cytidine1402-2'-O)-methyltransferase
MIMSQGKLYLIPTTLGDIDPKVVLPDFVIQRIQSLEEFIVEEVRTARRFLSPLKMAKPIKELKFHELSEHTDPLQVPFFLESAEKGSDIGLLSEAGCPCVADPGSILVQAAHEKGIEVVPMVGPSSLMLALMGSGMNGQHFAFVGYLPKEQGARIQKIKELERTAKAKGQTQLFIETPYRNAHMVEDLLKNCQPDTRLCLAADLTLPTQFVQTKAVSEWRKAVPDLGKRPTVFVIGA